MSLPRLLGTRLIRLYRLFISPVLGQNCRFHPSCSCYAEQAIERFGLLKGTQLGVRRLLRCHPFHPGGFDPVPDSEQTFKLQQHQINQQQPR